MDIPCVEIAAAPIHKQLCASSSLELRCIVVFSERRGRAAGDRGGLLEAAVIVGPAAGADCKVVTAVSWRGGANVAFEAALDADLKFPARLGRPFSSIA